MKKLIILLALIFTLFGCSSNSLKSNISYAVNEVSSEEVFTREIIEEDVEDNSVVEDIVLSSSESADLIETSDNTEVHSIALYANTNWNGNAWQITEGESFSTYVEIDSVNTTNDGITYYSEDDTIASINENGLVSAHKPGTTKIRVNYLDSEDYITVHVTEKVVVPEVVNGRDYVLNTNTKKFHYPSCSSAAQIKSKNRKDVCESRDTIIGWGYDPCKRCNP